MTAFDPVEIFQTSTMAALLDGVYEGNVSIRELLRHGDFGLGTFNSLDGEMLVLDGVCHQLRADGSATTAGLDELTPFAAVTWFRPDRTIEVPEPCDRAALKTLIDESLDNINLMVAVRVVGEFSAMRTRTVTRQPCPYRPFTEATHDQQEVTFTDVTGTLAGFRMPELSAGHLGRGLPLALHRQGPSPRRACTGLPAGPGNGRHQRQLGFAPELCSAHRNSPTPTWTARMSTSKSDRPREADMGTTEVRSAQRVVETLSAYGVRYVFGVPGAKIDAVFDALVDGGPELVVCRHEQNAAFMAAAVGRLTGTPGVALVTSGPGTTNLATGLITATTEQDPMIAICGAVARADRLKRTHQSMDAVAALKPFTKYTGEVNHPDNVPEAIANAIRAATTVPRGATAVVLPSDVSSSPTAAAIVSPSLMSPLGAAPADRIAAGCQPDSCRGTSGVVRRRPRRRSRTLCGTARAACCHRPAGRGDVSGRRCGLARP